MKPAIMFRIVVLPQPEGPTTETNSPCVDVERDVLDGVCCDPAIGIEIGFARDFSSDRVFI